MNIKLVTNKSIAYNSPDHINPFGALHNNTYNTNFNKKLYQLFNRQLFIMDLGCAGGGFIKECIDDGHIGVGLEGSDCRKKLQLPEWNTIPDNLFTCDITADFYLLYNETQIKFDVITMWDVLEHILESELSKLITNIKNNLHKDGIFISSINVASEQHRAQMNPNDFGPGKHHQNIQSIEWWNDFFTHNGFIEDEDIKQYFEPDWVRGPGCGCDAEATEERYFTPGLPAEKQWATITRVLRTN
jgi:hypothetical protein